ncbi:MAG: class I SAM-dependent methyltransferase [Pelomonas sp.]|nr:class I SAM-dependent methyltransferase [Roseateles sp.]
MTREAGIIELASWLRTPPGRYLLAWEQAQVDAAVADVFGFHALQLGLPALDALRANRMRERWLALDVAGAPLAAGLADAQGGVAVGDGEKRSRAAPALLCEFDELPFASASLDLVVLPHALELARDPHACLREVERVLRPEGRVVILGLNPASSWGLRQNVGRLGRASRPSFLPRSGDFIGYWRLRDWLRLLDLEVDAARFGCYRPPWKTETWLARWGFIEPIGARWWPVLGAVYFISAVKRRSGIRLIGLARSNKRRAKAAPAVALNKHHRR